MITHIRKKLKSLLTAVLGKLSNPMFLICRITDAEQYVLCHHTCEFKGLQQGVILLLDCSHLRMFFWLSYKKQYLLRRICLWLINHRSGDVLPGAAHNVTKITAFNKTN